MFITYMLSSSFFNTPIQSKCKFFSTYLTESPIGSLDRGYAHKTQEKSWAINDKPIYIELDPKLQQWLECLIINTLRETKEK